jgi:hypothetical protein
MDYYVYYQREDSRRPEVEQFFATFKKEVNLSQFNEGFFEMDPEKGKILKKNFFKKEKINGSWRFSVNIRTGMPCYELKKEISEVVLRNARQEKLKVFLTVISENAFRYF